MGPTFLFPVSTNEPQPNPRSDVHGRASVAMVAAGGSPPPVVIASPSSSAAMTTQSTQAPAMSRMLGEEYERCSSMSVTCTTRSDRPQACAMAQGLRWPDEGTGTEARRQAITNSYRGRALA
jgi:hypothetical protein